ncbi:hypothetical protein [Bacillus sp. RSS_NA_20]|uniref:hypothetical protein n=1 Tax=Bacillus sp. RSS_NA_20 TaxID=2876777 RepID=UPI001CC97924|nr:hypothetical protein [Bacillus sp. RSS_NA_20]MCA0119766.1 hypothetical protein [Bacillus sp. RSS_NA_20]
MLKEVLVLLKRDISLSISFFRNRFFFTILFILLFLASYYVRAFNGSMLDYIFYMFSGVNYENVLAKQVTIPIEWFVLQLAGAFIIGDFIQKDMNENAYQILIRLKRKYSYIVSKFMSASLVCVILYSVLIAIYGLVFAFSKENLIFTQTTIQQLIEGYKPSSIQILFLLVSALFCGTIIVTFVQIVLSLCIKSIYAFIINFFILSTSLVSSNCLLLGNNSMLIRHSLYMADSPINFQFMLVYMVLSLVVLFCIGIFIFKKKDIMSKSE